MGRLAAHPQTVRAGGRIEEVFFRVSRGGCSCRGGHSRRSPALAGLVGQEDRTVAEWWSRVGVAETEGVAAARVGAATTAWVGEVAAGVDWR